MPVTNLTSLLPFVLTAFGLLFVVRGLVTVTRERRRRSSWQAFPGRVVGSRLDDGQTRSRVAYVQDGHEFTFWNRYTSTTVTDPVGREVEVLVNPDDPTDAVVSAGLVGGTTVGLVMIGFGTVAAAVGLSLLA